jgi:SPX domain protein involved in polyphosphate accumulation
MKYLVTREQAEAIRRIMSQHMVPDHFGEYLVQNLYYDTDDWSVIRDSIEKPLYKEKMRLRCYGVPDCDSKFYLELKKKYKGIVYKRRIDILPKDLFGGSVREIVSEEDSQIARELDFYLKQNAVSEKIYISYKRIAYTGVEDEGLRVTFDTDIRFRLDRLHFWNPWEGGAILPRDAALMEVKTLGGMPLWLARALSENEVHPSPFSKYGACYTGFIMKPIERRVQISA